MTATKIDGKAISADVREDVATAVAALPGQPTLAVVLVGDDAASQVYVNSKIKMTEACGMRSLHHRLPADTDQSAVEAVIAKLNADDEVDGILLQLPLPDGLDADAAIEKIDPDKDVDGLTETSAGRLVLGKPGLTPCTPTGCVILAKRALGDNISGKHVVVIGRSILVGKPAALLFLAENCTVTIAHSRTKDIEALCRTADILVPAVGRPQMVKADWVKPGACVIDVGINRIDAPERKSGTRLVGDADYEACAEVAAHITPVPGGVGPMTIACLLRNTVLAACARRGWDVLRGFKALSQSFAPPNSPLFQHLWSSQNGLCALCGKAMPYSRFHVPHATVWKKRRPTFDHIHAKGRGGSDKDENLQLAHARCNKRKGRGTA